ncbi:MAG TPA: hypothetical protein VNZ22_15725, partial [Bacillota bacterium]|nr:hypothetical protein [Bacillota bacterium]
MRRIPAGSPARTGRTSPKCQRVPAGVRQLCHQLGRGQHIDSARFVSIAWTRCGLGPGTSRSNPTAQELAFPAGMSRSKRVGWLVRSIARQLAMMPEGGPVNWSGVASVANASGESFNSNDR